MSKQTIVLKIRATPHQIKAFKEYTRDLGYRHWKTPLEQAAHEELFTEAEIAEMEKQ